MILKQLKEEIEHYRAKLIERSEKKVRILDEPLRSFALSILSREVVHPLPENRIGGLLTLFRVFTFPRSNHRAIRICIQDKFDHIYVTTILEYLALRECYFKIMLGMGRPVSTCELLLAAVDSYCLSRLEKIILDNSPIIESFAGYDVSIRHSRALMRFFFRISREAVELRHRICRLVNISITGIRNLAMVNIDVEDDLLIRMRYIIRLLSTAQETRSGLLHYQLLQLG